MASSSDAQMRQRFFCIAASFLIRLHAHISFNGITEEIRSVKRPN